VAGPFTLTALPSSPTGSVRTVASVVALLVPAALMAWPLIVVLVHGLTERGAWPLTLALDSLLIALAATLAALVPATSIALALGRGAVIGRRTLQRVFGLGVFIPPFIVPLALVTLGVRRGTTALVFGQALAFLPIAVALLVRALREVPVELEQAAEILGARRWTVARRVTLALVGPGVLRAALVVLGLCLADVATPLLLAGPRGVLATAVAASEGAAAPALLLGLIATTIALWARTWREVVPAIDDWPGQRRPDRLAPDATGAVLGALAWAVAIVLAASWLLVPVMALAHVSVLGDRAIQHTLGRSVLLGLGAAGAGTMLALVTGWIVERRRSAAAGAVALMLHLPVAVPGVVAGVGYLLVVRRGPGSLEGGALLAAMLLVACWELPVTSRLARQRLARVDHSIEEAALGLGASGGTTLTRIVLPTLAPAAAGIFAHTFAAGVVAVGAVIVLTGPGPGLGAIALLTLAAAGATGAACAVATVLLAVAGGAVWLGRTPAVR
jgi:iron(III) transport system permease protein